MREEDRDYLRLLVQERPELVPVVDVNRHSAYYQGQWKRILRVIPRTAGFELALTGGARLRVERSDSLDGNRSGQRMALLSLLRGHFPTWRIERCLAGTDRVRHQTASFLRVLLASGLRRKLCVIAYPGSLCCGSVDRALTSLTLWWNDLRHHRLQLEGLLMVPESWEESFLRYFPFLDIPLRCFKYWLAEGMRKDSPGRIRQIYPGPVVSTEVRSPYVMYPLGESPPKRLREIHSRFPFLEMRRRPGGWQLSCVGLPVVWERGFQLFYDCLRPRILSDGNVGALECHIRKVRKVRRCPPSRPEHPYYSLRPEGWLERLVAAEHRLLNGDFLPVIYAQVPTFVDGERKILDLLTVTSQGRIAVIEVKVEKNLEMIFQALDYWDRVRTHAGRGDFQRNGYFPGVRLDPADPLLYLVSPLFEFHRILPVVRSYLGANVRLECIGVNSDWRRGIRVLRKFAF